MRPLRKKNSTVTPGEITSKVAKVIKHYWVLAGYENVSSPKNKIAKLLKDYQHQQKYKNIKYKKDLEDRSKFVNKLLDIAPSQDILYEDQSKSFGKSSCHAKVKLEGGMRSPIIHTTHWVKSHSYIFTCNRAYITIIRYRWPPF